MADVARRDNQGGPAGLRGEGEGAFPWRQLEPKAEAGEMDRWDRESCRAVVVRRLWSNWGIVTFAGKIPAAAGARYKRGAKAAIATPLYKGQKIFQPKHKNKKQKYIKKQMFHCHTIAEVIVLSRYNERLIYGEEYMGYAGQDRHRQWAVRLCEFGASF